MRCEVLAKKKRQKQIFLFFHVLTHFAAVGFYLTRRHKIWQDCACACTRSAWVAFTVGDLEALDLQPQICARHCFRRWSWVAFNTYLGMRSDQQDVWRPRHSWTAAKEGSGRASRQQNSSLCAYEVEVESRRENKCGLSGGGDPLYCQ